MFLFFFYAVMLFSVFLFGPWVNHNWITTDSMFRFSILGSLIFIQFQCFTGLLQCNAKCTTELKMNNSIFVQIRTNNEKHQDVEKRIWKNAKQKNKFKKMSQKRKRSRRSSRWFFELLPSFHCHGMVGKCIHLERTNGNLSESEHT